MLLAVAAALLGVGLLAWLMEAGATRAAARATPVETTGQPIATTVVPTDTPTPVPKPTPTPIPVVYAVQGDGNAVYLLEKPGFTILAEIPGGDVVTPRDDVAPVQAGGYTWVAVTYQGADGWLQDTQIFPAHPGYEVLPDPGLYLYDAPQGVILNWLYPGTAYYVRQQQEHWTGITLLDGRQGWIVRQEGQP
jgi:hypothetical protein